ncbi:MAG: DUF6089 family protein [Cytophagaceae bacterium]
MTWNKKYWLCCIFYCFIVFNAFSQNYNPRCRYTGFGLSLNSTFFQGDIGTHPSLLRPGLGLHINRQVSPRSHIMIELNWARLIGDDYISTFQNKELEHFMYTRNLHFRNDIKELAVIGQLDLIPSLDHDRKRPIYNIYFLYGLIIFHHNPKAKDVDGRWVDLRPLRTENRQYSAINLAIPLGAGFRYKINIQWDVEFEASYRFTSTDYLDDVSRRYPFPEQLGSSRVRQLSNRSGEEVSAFSGRPRDMEFLSELGNQIVEDEESGYRYASNHAPGTERGSRFGWDSYVMCNIRIRYNIPVTVNCPKFRENY